MKCSKCACDAVITQRYSGMSLCPLHFTEDFESRAKKAIRKHGWLSPNDCIAVDFDGSLAAAALLHMLAKFFGKRPDIRLIAVGDDEETLKEVAERYGIEYALGSAPVSATHKTSASANVSASVAEKLGCTKIAVAATLDSEAEFVFECILKGDSDALLCRGRSSEIPRIMPLMNIPAAEAELYCRIHGIKTGSEKEHEIRDNCTDAEFPKLAKELLDEYAGEHPAAKYALVNLMEEFQSADMRDDS